MTIIYFIIGLGLLIFIHELGHFLVAKLNGIRVERFSIGFGPRLFKFRKGETEYCLSLLPLGGYVKMTGQEDFGEEELVPLDDPKAFNQKSLLSRLSVVLAGPAMNLILPFLIMPVVFMLGRQEPKFLAEIPKVIAVQADSPAAKADLKVGDQILRIEGKEVSDWRDFLNHSTNTKNLNLTIQRDGKSLDKTLSLSDSQAKAWGVEPMLFWDMDPVVGDLIPGAAAEKAGMKVKDRIVNIDGVEIDNWKRMSESVDHGKGKELQVTVEREGQKVDLKIVPVFNASLKKYVIGVSKAENPDLYQNHRYGLSEAFKASISENAELFRMTFKVLKDLVTLKASYKDLGGPIRIAQVSAKAAEKGIANFLYLLAFLSVQLGVLNLLPIPVLDGGHVVFMLYEGAVGHPLSPKKRMIAQQVGMFLLLTLMLLVTVNDIDSVWGFKDMFVKIRSWF